MTTRRMRGCALPLPSVKAPDAYRKGNPLSEVSTGVAGSRKRALKGLSRMKGNFHVRFLGGGSQQCDHATRPFLVPSHMHPPSRCHDLTFLLTITTFQRLFKLFYQCFPFHFHPSSAPPLSTMNRSTTRFAPVYLGKTEENRVNHVKDSNFTAANPSCPPLVR